jgi:polysaccharide biosynthesis/export protein
MDQVCSAVLQGVERCFRPFPSAMSPISWPEVKQTDWFSEYRRATSMYSLGKLLAVFLVFSLGLQAADEVRRSDSSTLAKSDGVRSTYVLGPDDQISIRALHAEEIVEKPVQIDSEGFLKLPLIGRVKASDRTVEQLEADLTNRLKVYVNDPQVSVNIVDFRSQPVSVIGSVNNPGVIQLRGHKTLVEVLSMAGGLRGDAGYRIQITRKEEWGPLPLPGAKSQEGYSIAEVEIKPLLEARDPVVNIAMKPNDIVSVPRGEMVYVTGEVRRAGGFVLHETESLSVLQALALAEGAGPTSSLRNAKILRAHPDSSDRTELRVDLHAIIAGKASDVRLQSGDILFIPGSFAKKASMRSIEAGIQVGTGMAVWRF